MQPVSQNVYKNAPQEISSFSRIDLQNACSQMNLNPEMDSRFTYNIARGNITDTYVFKTHFCGLTDMPAEFQKDR